MNNKASNKAIFYFVLFLLPMLACQTILGGAQEIPAAVPTEEYQLPVSSDIYFIDDFSSPDTGWLVDSGDGYEANYGNGGYFIFLARANTLLTSASSYQTPVADVSVRVDAQQISEGDQAFFGVTCRYVDLNNFYMLRITSGGYYSIGKWVNNEFTVLGSGDWEESSAILQGDQWNYVQGDCSGSHLSLYANGTLLMDVNDSSLTQGGYGIVVGTIGDEENAGVNFDNFLAMVP